MQRLGGGHILIGSVITDNNKEGSNEKDVSERVVLS